MPKLDFLQNLRDGFLILEWLLIGYLFYTVNNTIAIYLFIAFIIGTVIKVIILREEEKLENEFIEKLHQKLEKEIDNNE